MNRQTFSEQMGSLLKLIRTEYSLTQDEMAVIMGISKKTLVETEKKRRNLSWSEAVVLASVFSQSNILQNAFGGDISDMIPAIAFQDIHVKYPHTMGGKVWWNTIQEEGGYRIQQNMISRHYRLLNAEDQRIVSSFELSTVKDYLQSILEKNKE